MANVICNIAKGKIVELYNRVKSNDPANSALIIVPLETSGLEADSVLIDKDTLSDLVSGTTNEATTGGWTRKTLTDADLAALPAPDDTNDWFQVSIPTITWTTVSGNPISKIAICYDGDTTAGTDANIMPLVLLDVSWTPDGGNVQLTGGPFFKAA